MKRTQQCPKCQGRKLWVVETFKVPSEMANGEALPVAMQAEEGGFFAMGKIVPQGSFELWVCAGCGFSELWARDLGALRDDPSRGVRLVDTTVSSERPFR